MDGKIGVFVGQGEMDKNVVQPVNCGISVQFEDNELEYICHINDLNSAMFQWSKKQGASR
jgi:hypothetical protein